MAEVRSWIMRCHSLLVYGFIYRERLQRKVRVAICLAVGVLRNGHLSFKGIGGNAVPPSTR